MRRKPEKNPAKRRGKKQMPMWPFYALLVLLVLLYALHNSFILGVLIFLVIMFILFLEVKISVATEGKKKSVVDIIVALAAVLIFWFALIIILQTSSPIDTVASCSMLPTLHRGDLVVLHGIGNPAIFAKSHDIPIVNMSKAEFQSLESNMQNEFLSYYAYYENKSRITSIVPIGSSYSIGLYNNYCIYKLSYFGEQNKIYTCYVGSQDNNIIKYNYSIGNVVVGGKEYNIIYTSSIDINNISISQNFSNPIIVYRTTSRDYFSGDIIHRVYAMLNVSGSYYFLTMGDNNPGLDIEFANYPPSSSNVLGYVVGDIPVLGYIKLIISGQFGAVAGCNQTILRGS
ncbi:MAG: hypothetical protein ACP5RK_01900 [Candidatus Micrarchaeia archaeon]